MQSDGAGQVVVGWKLQQREAVPHTRLGGPVLRSTPEQREVPQKSSSNALRLNYFFNLFSFQFFFFTFICV